MSLRKSFRVAMLLLTFGLPVLAAGCSDNPREPGGGGRATGTTEVGGGVTTASPGGANVQPNEGTGTGVR
jgi:hypothetical protein